MSQEAKTPAKKQITLSPAYQAKLYERANMGNYVGPTKLQRVTCQRNWCRYMLAGMEGLVKFMYTGGWLSEHCHTQMKRAITSARWSVDTVWEERKEEILYAPPKAKKRK